MWISIIVGISPSLLRGTFQDIFITCRRGTAVFICFYSALLSLFNFISLGEGHPIHSPHPSSIFLLIYTIFHFLDDPFAFHYGCTICLVIIYHTLYKTCFYFLNTPFIQHEYLFIYLFFCFKSLNIPQFYKLLQKLNII